MIRHVVGRSVAPLDDFAALRGDRRVLLDVGTGDGKHVVHEAKRRPDWLVVGVDAAPAQLQRASTAAARKPAKGGLANALFVQGSAEALPLDLAPVTEIHVLMPWGSLLRGCLGSDSVLPSLRAVAEVGTPLLITLNLHAWRPPVADVGASAEPTPDSVLTDLVASYAAAGWQLDAARYLGEEDIAALATSWGRRLHSTREQFDVLAIEAVAT